MEPPADGRARAAGAAGAAGAARAAGAAGARCSVCQRCAREVFCEACVAQIIAEQRRSLDEHRRQAASAAAAATGRLETQTRTAMTRRLAADLRKNLEEYRSYAAAARAKLARERDALRKRQQDVQARRQRLAAAQKALSRRHALMLGDKGMSGALLHGLSMQLEDYEERVALERKKLIVQLLAFFPLEFGGKDENREDIADLPLPSDMRQLKAMNEDARSAALAIFVRVLLIASSYLSLTLPYRMVFLGSKASIGRWGGHGQQIMLVGNGTALETGMDMLRKNVEALCFYQGIPPYLVKEWGLIHSLWLVFNSPSLGNSVQQSIIEADTRVGRVRAGQSLQRPVQNDDTPSKAVADRNAQEQHIVRAAEGNADAARMSASAASDSIDFVSLDDVQDASAQPAAGDNWDFIERPQPPKPSNNDDIQHWVSSGALDT